MPTDESSSTERPRPLRLKRREERRIRAGHLWVFSNEIDIASTPLRLFEPGDPVIIRSASGRFLAGGYVNPHSLIAARVLTRDVEHPFDNALLTQRIAHALRLRERLFATPHYRLVFGESDLLPGLVVDRHGDILAAQITTAGMERMKDAVLASLGEVVGPAGVLWQNTAGVRELEGLPRYTEVAGGEVPESVVVEEGGAVFHAPLATGQKTGWFYDQRRNRERLARYAPGEDVLDVYSYVGGFGVQAALAGARSVTCIDSSTLALDYVGRNAAENGVSITARAGDAAGEMAALRAANRRFGVVVLDPPAFVRKRKDMEAGLNAYRRIVQLGMQLLDDDGILLACSCSSHLAESDLLGVVQGAARRTGRFAQLLESGGQGPDHPVHPAISETRYLKALFCRVSTI